MPSIGSGHLGGIQGGRGMGAPEEGCGAEGDASGEKGEVGAGSFAPDGEGGAACAQWTEPLYILNTKPLQDVSGRALDGMAPSQCARVEIIFAELPKPAKSIGKLSPPKRTTAKTTAWITASASKWILKGMTLRVATSASFSTLPPTIDPRSPPCLLPQAYSAAFPRARNAPAFFKCRLRRTPL